MKAQKKEFETNSKSEGPTRSGACPWGLLRSNWGK